MIFCLTYYSWIIFRELQLIFDTKNWVQKSKNALIWWLRALSFCQIWKYLLVPMNVDLKDYLILGASLGNVFPWITIIYIPIKTQGLFWYLVRRFWAVLSKINLYLAFTNHHRFYNFSMKAIYRRLYPSGWCNLRNFIKI